MKYEVTIGEDVYTIEVSQNGQVILNDQVIEVDFTQIGDSGLYSLLVDNQSFEALVELREGVWQVLLMGDLYEVQVMDERAQLMKARASTLAPETGEVAIKAPMPGLVVAMPVEVGQEIVKGDNLVILESMKMENELKAPRAGRVERVNVNAGDSVEQNQTLVVIV